MTDDDFLTDRLDCGRSLHIPNIFSSYCLDLHFYPLYLYISLAFLQFYLDTQRFSTTFISLLPRASHNDPLSSAGDGITGVVPRLPYGMQMRHVTRRCVSSRGLPFIWARGTWDRSNACGCAGSALFGTNNVGVSSRFAEMGRRCLEDVCTLAIRAETRTPIRQGDCRALERPCAVRCMYLAGNFCDTPEQHVHHASPRHISAFAISP